MARPNAAVLLFVLICLAAAAAAQDCYDYRDTFQVAEPFPFGGTVTSLAADQDRAVAARGTDLVFLDIADPGAVATLGTHTLGEAPLEVSSAGYLAAVASDNSLMMVDWSDPTASHVTAAMPLPVGFRSLSRCGDILLISCGENGVLVYETDADGELLYRGVVDTPGSALAATMHAGWLVVADTTALLAVDITDPAAPVTVATYTEFQVPAEDRYVDQVQSRDGALVVSAVRWYGGMYGGPATGLDLMATGPAGELSLVATDHCAGGSPRYAVRGGTLHVSVDDAYRLYDLADFPTRAVSIETGVVGLLVASEATVLHRTSGSEFSIYDVRHPFYVTPDPAWNGAAFHDIAAGQHESGWVLKTRTDWSGLVFEFHGYLYDVHDPAAVVELTGLSYSGGYEDYANATICAGDAGRVFVYFETGYGTGCRLSDLSTGSEVTTWLPYSRKAVIAGDRAYQITGGWDPADGVACLDISTPGVVTELGFWPGTVYDLVLALDETTLVILNGDLQIIDFSDPAEPAVRGTLPSVDGSFLERRGDRLYLAGSLDSIIAIDISDLDAPSLVWTSANLGGTIRALEFSGDLAAVATNGFSGSSARIYDLGSDLVGPVAVSPVLPADNYLHDLLWHGDILYTSELMVYNVADPAQPVLLGRGTNGRSKLERRGDAIVTASGVFPVQCVATGVTDDGEVPGLARGLELRAAPNPFNPRTTVQFVLPTAGAVRLVLYDLAGRRVRTLLAGHRPAGPHAVVWDGRDEEGREAASGVYVARLTAGAKRTGTKLVLVR